MSEQNIDTAKKGYEAFSAGDLEGALSIFDDAAEWTVHGESTISGTHQGRAGLTELFGRLAEKSTQVEPKRFLADGDGVVGQTEITVEGEKFHEADFYTFGGGKIVKAESFGDTSAQERLFGSKRVAAG